MTPPKIIDVGPIHMVASVDSLGKVYQRIYTTSYQSSLEMVDLLAPVQQDDCDIAIYRLRGGFWERVATYNRETKEMF